MTETLAHGYSSESTMNTNMTELNALTLTLLVAKGQYEILQKTWKMTETLVHGNSSESTQQELSNEYKHDWV